MTYLLDSDIVIDWLKGKSATVSLVAPLRQDGLAISIITYGEVLEGVYFARDPRRAEAGFREFLRWVQVVPLNRRVMQRFARIRGELRREGRLIGDPDLLIAATALQANMSLITGNTAHFERVPDLRLYSPP